MNNMSTEANKKYHVTNVPFSAYRVGAKHILHINRAVKAIRRNDCESLKEVMEKDPSVHKSGARKPVLFFAIKCRKSVGLHAIVNDPGFDQAYRAYATGSWSTLTLTCLMHGKTRSTIRTAISILYCYGQPCTTVR